MMTRSAAPAPMFKDRTTARATARRLAALAALAGAVLLPPAAMAQRIDKPIPAAPGAAPAGAEPGRTISLERVPRLVVTLGGRILLDETGRYEVDGPLPPPEGLRGPGCPVEVSTHTDSDFISLTGQPQAGFSQAEIAAASYPLPAASFPIKFESSEMIFATSNASEVTTTQWSILLYDGPPSNGNLVYQESSLDGILPPIILGPGTEAVIVQVMVDPNDPEQVFFLNASGTSTISVGYRIDVHNEQIQDPCLVAPPQDRNAFPVVDIGLHQPARNWLFGLNCGPIGCPDNGGWSTFQALRNICRPSGDWIVRMSWSSVNCIPGTGACCLPGGTCEVRSQTECTQAGGVYQGDETVCGMVNCPQPTGACCFGGSCLDLSEIDCAQAQGTWLGAGSACAPGNVCPVGACCLPDGSCDVLDAGACAAAGGIFRGVGAPCETADCPQPTGACCLSSGGCIVLTEADCAIIPGSAWGGAGTTCADGCACEADWNGDTQVNSNDISAFLTDWLASVQGGTLEADFDGSGMVNSNDISAFLTAWLEAVTEGC